MSSKLIYRKCLKVGCNEEGTEEVEAVNSEYVIHLCKKHAEEELKKGRVIKI